MNAHPTSGFEETAAGVLGDGLTRFKAGQFGHGGLAVGRIGQGGEGGGGQWASRPPATTFLRFFAANFFAPPPRGKFMKR